jgi:Set1/Ash2 histone methyltransferase complex subunit ASH2
MARASLGASSGNWYFEIDILPHSGNTRLGWCTEKGDLQAPVGLDKYSYSYRDKEGTKFHQSRGKPYGEGYGMFILFIVLFLFKIGPGDTLGFYISLPPETKPLESEDSVKKDEEPAVHQGSKIVFFKNGKNQGDAFTNIFAGLP